MGGKVPLALFVNEVELHHNLLRSAEQIVLPKIGALVRLIRPSRSLAHRVRHDGHRFCSYPDSYFVAHPEPSNVRGHRRATATVRRPAMLHARPGGPRG